MVRKAICRKNNDEVAIKTIIKKTEMEQSLLKNEIELLLETKHDNIINLRAAFEDETKCHLVFDLVQGGDLFEYISSFNFKPIPETIVKNIFSQIIDCLHFLHSIHIMHRDLKPENFLISSDCKVYLIDFGFAIQTTDKSKDRLGCLDYMSPELVSNSEYGQEVDCWAVGVVLYNLLTGRNPFSATSDKLLEFSILKDEPTLRKISTDAYDKSVIDVLQGLFEKNPKDRLTMSDLKQMEWVRHSSILNTYQSVFVADSEKIKAIVKSLREQINIKARFFNLFLETMSSIQIEKCRQWLKTKLTEERETNYMVCFGLLKEGNFFKAAVEEEFRKLVENNEKVASEQVFNFDREFEICVKTADILFEDRDNSNFTMSKKVKD